MHTEPELGTRATTEDLQAYRMFWNAGKFSAIYPDMAWMTDPIPQLVKNER